MNVAARSEPRRYRILVDVKGREDITISVGQVVRCADGWRCLPSHDGSCNGWPTPQAALSGMAGAYRLEAV